MQTVNFQCGHCGKLMAVSLEFLGQQVRCPHCQQVVLAPAANPATAGPVTMAPFLHVSMANHDDIFSAPGECEDLFGQSAAGALDMPLDIPTATEPTGAPLPELVPTHADTAPPADPSAPSPADASTATLPWMPAAEAARTAPTPETAPAEETLPTTEPVSVRRARSEAERVNWFIPLVFIPLVLYAVLATAAAGLLYIRVQTNQRISPFEQMPDVEGDHPGVRKNKAGVRLRFDRAKAIARLPEHLIVPLGESLRVGDLEVTPLRVERKRVSVMVEGFDKPEPCEHDSLVLHLRLRNLADDYAFTPLDNFFDRHWDGKGESAPLTVLMVGSRPFFGGPARWLPLNRPRRDNTHREWLLGRKNTDPEGLSPGEECTTFICTDGGNAAIPEVLFGIDATGKPVAQPYQGQLLWRVHLRRGLIHHKDRLLPAACVIGIAFTSKDYNS